MKMQLLAIKDKEDKEDELEVVLLAIKDKEGELEVVQLAIKDKEDWMEMKQLKDCPVCMDAAALAEYPCRHKACFACFIRIRDRCPLCRVSLVWTGERPPEAAMTPQEERAIDGRLRAVMNHNRVRDSAIRDVRVLVIFEGEIHIISEGLRPESTIKAFKIALALKLNAVVSSFDYVYEVHFLNDDGSNYSILDNNRVKLNNLDFYLRGFRWNHRWGSPRLRAELRAT
jgi:hypothetical protein